MGVIVHRSNKEYRFNVHDVVEIKEEVAPLITGTHNMGETGDATSIISIIRRILAVKAKHRHSQEKYSARDSEVTSSPKSNRNTSRTPRPETKTEILSDIGQPKTSHIRRKLSVRVISFRG